MHGIYLVTRRDYLGYVSAWGFWLGLLFTPLILIIFMLAPSFAASSQPTRYFTVLEPNAAFSQALQAEMDKSLERQARAMIDPMADIQGQDSTKLDLFDAAIAQGATPRDAFESAGGNPAVLLAQQDFVQVEPPAKTIDALRPYLLGEKLLATPTGEQPLFAAFSINSETSEIEYWSENLQNRSLLDRARIAEKNYQLDVALSGANVDRALLSQASDATRNVVQQKVREEATEQSSEVTMSDRAPFIVSIMMAFSLWFLIFSVINYLLMGTIEERSNKIFDSLLTSVKLPNLLAGKLLAVLLLALTLMAFWGTGSTLVTLLVSDRIPPELADAASPLLSAATNPVIFGPAVISFLLGYLMYGSLFLALGSLCDTIQEAQTLMTPLFVLLMAPLVMLTFAIQDANSPFIQMMAWVPFFTPFLLILRIPTEPPVWEIFAQLGLMAGTTLVTLYLATRVYRAGAVHGAGVNDVWVFFGKLIPGRHKTDTATDAGRR